MNKHNKGFTLVEMIVAMMVLAVITVPILVMFYFGAVQVARQTASTQELSIARETMQLIIDDLKKNGSLQTGIETVGNVTKLVISDRVTYAYDSNSKVLIRVVDNLQSVVLSEEQLGDRFYKQEELEKYVGLEPVIFEKDNTQNTISVYIRLKMDQEAQVQESKYLYYIKQEASKVIKVKQGGYIKVNSSETLNLRNSSFALETWFCPHDIANNRCIFNLLNGTKSKVKLYIKDNTLKLDMDETEISDASINIEDILDFLSLVTVVYDDYHKNIKIYLDGILEKTIPYDTTNIFSTGSSDAVPNTTLLIDNIYIGNESNVSGNSFLGELYEPRIWTTATNIYIDSLGNDKLNYNKVLTGREDGLAVYIKDDYTKIARDGKIVFQIKNAVNNKVMEWNNVEVDEE